MANNNNPIASKIGATISGVTNTLTVTNPSNTASSAARETIVVGGGTAGDPTLNFNVTGVTNWEMGIDNSSSDSFKLAQGTALGTNDTFIMTTAGERTMPLQPAFLYVLQSNDLNATGDSTGYILGSGNALTQIFDQNSDCTTAGIFTAPVTGIYSLRGALKIGNISAAMTCLIMNIFTTSKVFPVNVINPAACRTVTAFPDLLTVHGGVITRMSAGDTASIRIGIYGGTKTATIHGDANGNSWFCGSLLC